MMKFAPLLSWVYKPDISPFYPGYIHTPTRYHILITLQPHWTNSFYSIQSRNKDSNNTTIHTLFFSREDAEDRMSDISGLSDLSGSDWKPTAGPYSWVQRQMMSGTDPRWVFILFLDRVKSIYGVYRRLYPYSKSIYGVYRGLYPYSWVQRQMISGTDPS